MYEYGGVFVASGAGAERAQSAADPVGRLVSNGVFLAGPARAAFGSESNGLDRPTRSGWIYDESADLLSADQWNNGRNVALRQNVDMAHGVL